ncbi:LysE family translocator [Providencia rettgeri]|uniref:LysE family translocator n=1 Tax=Providencia rettgeri TaxID=587 RepID=UPI00029C6B45|nr:LysE family translocator [Providencia rettgeri]EKT54511.1 LysE family transporter [Providencia rettgeri Dmel1]
MNLETLLALSLFSFVTSITPGPNNIMLLASGINFGFSKTLPHSFGVSIGFLIMLFAVGLGVGALIQSSPITYSVLKYFGIIYLFWLAWKTTISHSVAQSNNQEIKPLTFLEAALFQWINPKAWMMAISGMAMYTNINAPYLSMVQVAVIFAAINWPCVAIWAMFGSKLREKLKQPKTLRRFNLVMGVLLALSGVSVLFQ